jgi:hypothetical protein
MTTTTTKRRRGRHKPPPKIVTTRPDTTDGPVRAYRFGACVIVETDHRRVVLTPEECQQLAAVLILQGDLARRTPREGQTKQLPD